jgi:hypothetical protein
VTLTLIGARIDQTWAFAVEIDKGMTTWGIGDDDFCVYFKHSRGINNNRRE